MRISDERFLDTLTPDDVGYEVIGKRIIRFEGFTDECWVDAYKNGTTTESLEREIIRDWASRQETKELKLVEYAWWTEDIFYAIYRLS